MTFINSLSVTAYHLNSIFLHFLMDLEGLIYLVGIDIVNLNFILIWI
jgi:hypothetical protein